MDIEFYKYLIMSLVIITDEKRGHHKAHPCAFLKFTSVGGWQLIQIIVPLPAPFHKNCSAYPMNS